MKQIIFTLCFLITLFSVTQAAEFQKCIDKNGNIILTNNPPPDVKCASTGIENIKGKQEQTQANKQEVKQDEISRDEETIKKRIQTCVTCCTDKKQIFLNMNQDLRLGDALFEECVTTCKSEGNTSSEWSDCWSRSEKQLKAN